jgi:hypothetical protein
MPRSANLTCETVVEPIPPERVVVVAVDIAA